MKKLIILSFILLMNFNLFSQKDTLQTSNVILTEEVAKKVVQDLIRFDRVEQENRQLSDLTGMYEKKINYLEDISITLDRKIEQKNSIIELQSSQLELKSRQTKVFEKRYKTEKRKKTLYLILGTISTISLSTLLISK